MSDQARRSKRARSGKAEEEEEEGREERGGAGQGRAATLEEEEVSPDLLKLADEADPTVSAGEEGRRGEAGKGEHGERTAGGHQHSPLNEKPNTTTPCLDP